MSVEAKVKSIIAEQLGVGEDEIKAESAFIEDLGAADGDFLQAVADALRSQFRGVVVLGSPQPLHILYDSPRSGVPSIGCAPGCPRH